MFSTVESTNTIKHQGDFNVGRGQLGQTVTSILLGDVNQESSFMDIYDKYILDGGLVDRTFTLAVINNNYPGTPGGVGVGYSALILNNGTTNNIIIEDASLVTIVILAPGNATKLVSDVTSWNIINFGGGGVNIYNSDGVLTGNRTVDQDNNNLTFENVENFTINPYTGTGSGCSIIKDNTSFIGSGNDGVGFVCNPVANQNYYCAAANFGAGLFSGVGWSDVGTNDNHSIQANSLSAQINCFNGGTSVNENITVDSISANPYTGTGQTTITTNALRLNNIPFSNNSPNGQPLSRNSLTGVLELEPSLRIYDAVIPDQYTTISSALADSKKFIFVRNGTHTEVADIVLTDGVCIQGQGKDAIIDGAGGDIKITANTPFTYGIGTVSLTFNSTTIIGSGTLWVTAGAQAGDMIRIAEQESFHVISSVDSETQITLAGEYLGTTLAGSSYEIFRPIHFKLMSLTLRNYVPTGTNSFITLTGCSVGTLMDRLIIEDVDALGDRIVDYLQDNYGCMFQNSIIRRCRADNGIRAQPENSDIALENIHISNHQGIGYGLNCNNATLLNCSARKCQRGFGNSGSGIASPTPRVCRYINCTAYYCTQVGFTQADAEVVALYINCSAIGTTNADGSGNFDAGSGFAQRSFISSVYVVTAQYVNCIASKNNGNGFIIENQRVTYDSCIASENTGNGFKVGTGGSPNSKISWINCRSADNGGNGILIETSTDNSIIGGFITDNTGDAIHLQSTNIIISGVNITGSATNGILQDNVGIGAHSLVTGCRIDGFTNTVNDVGGHVIQVNIL